MKLYELAHCRAGDKGDISNLCVIARDPAHYATLVRLVTAAAVTRHLGERVKGAVVRYELPQLQALNFVLQGTLGGGVTRSLALDAHGKCLAGLLLGLPLGRSAE